MTMHDSMTFEQAMVQLEQLIKQFEQGKFSLEQAISAYQEAQRLQTFCEEKLQKYTLMIKEFEEIKN